VRISSSVQGSICASSQSYPVQRFGMPLSRLLRRSSQPTLARSGPADAKSGTSDDSNTPTRRGRQASELMSTIRGPWKAKRPSITDQSNPSKSPPTPPLTFKAKGSTTESGADKISSPVPAVPSLIVTNDSIVPSPEIVPAVGTVPEKLDDAWDPVKEDPKIANSSRALDTVGVS
jgi:hypothetical protein